MTAASLDQAALLRVASRTFALGIERLGSGLRREVRTAYLLLRVSDFLEDNEEMPPERKAYLLEEWCRVLEGQRELPGYVREVGPVTADTPDAEVARHVESVVAAFRALEMPARSVLSKHVCATSRGMARWALRGSDFPTEVDLDDYMHEVAGRVGYLLTDLFALRSTLVAERRPALLELGREFGLGLQTVNVIRGLHEDRHRGWLYVPESFLGGGSVPPGQLFEPRYLPVALTALDRLVRKAEGHLGAAVRYVERVPRRMHRVRVFCALPLFFAIRTLAQCRSNPDVFFQEVKISRDEVAEIATATQVRGWSNRWLRDYAEYLGLRPDR